MAGVITQAASGVQRVPRASRHGTRPLAQAMASCSNASMLRAGCRQPSARGCREREGHWSAARTDGEGEVGGEHEQVASWEGRAAGCGQGDRGWGLCEVERCGWSAGSSAASHEGWLRRRGEREDLLPICRTGIKRSCWRVRKHQSEKNN